MKSTAETRVNSFIGRVEDTCGLDDRENILAMVSAAPRAIVNELALRYVLVNMVSNMRKETLAVERAAETVAPMPPEPSRKWKNPNKMGKYEFEEFQRSPEYGQWCEQQAELAVPDRRIDDEFYAKVAEITAEWKAELHIEWTQELLNSVIALPDGTRVTWGTATLEQHRARAEMFMNNAVANLEGAARHEKAIEELSRSGATTLNELLYAGVVNTE